VDLERGDRSGCDRGDLGHLMVPSLVLSAELLEAGPACRPSRAPTSADLCPCASVHAGRRPISGGTTGSGPRCGCHARRYRVSQPLAELGARGDGLLPLRRRPPVAAGARLEDGEPLGGDVQALEDDGAQRRPNVGWDALEEHRQRARRPHLTGEELEAAPPTTHRWFALRLL